MLKIDKNDLLELRRNGSDKTLVTNGWEKQVPAHNGGSGSKYKKYENQMVIMVGYSKNNKPQNIYFTSKVMDVLGNPKEVEIYVRGFNMAFVNAGDRTGYKVTTITKVKGVASKITANITAAALLGRWNMRSGVYNCHFETGMVILDINQLPSEL